jgi:hypothetical protein
MKNRSAQLSMVRLLVVVSWIRIAKASSLRAFRASHGPRCNARAGVNGPGAEDRALETTRRRQRERSESSPQRELGVARSRDSTAVAVACATS